MLKSFRELAAQPDAPLHTDPFLADVAGWFDRKHRGLLRRGHAV